MSRASQLVKGWREDPQGRILPSVGFTRKGPVQEPVIRHREGKAL